MKWTGQQKAAGTGFAISMLGCFLVLAVEPLELIDIRHPLSPWMLLGGFTAAIPSFIWLCVAVRCPRCRARVVWSALSKDAHPRGLNAILESTECPFCGFPSVTAHNSSSADKDEEVVALQGPVERVNGSLALMIPLDAGGDKFLQCSRGISEIQGDYLTIAIPEWMASVLRIEEGDFVSVDNANGKFNISPVTGRPVH